MEKVNKPIMVARQEFIENLIGLVNNSGRPAFVMQPIVKDIANELANSVNQQFLAEKQQYEEALSKEGKDESENS